MRWKKLCAICGAAVLITSTAFSAESDSISEVRAHEIDYDMDTGVVAASGKVFMSNSAKAGAPASQNKIPSEVNADNVSYDMNTGVINASGNVLLKYGSDRATGERASYNTNTQEAYLSGGVIVTREDLKITCENLYNDAYGHMQATGNVHGVQKIAPSAQYPNGDTRTFTGEHVDYYPNDKKHIFIPTGGLITGNDGNFSADQMEAWLDDEYYTGTGNVHIVNPPRELEAGGDRVDYYAKNNGRAVLTGNAWAIQKNNTLRGNSLTVYLADERKTPAVENPAPAATPFKTKTYVAPHEILTDRPFEN